MTADTGCIHDYMRNCPQGCHRVSEARRDEARKIVEWLRDFDPHDYRRDSPLWELGRWATAIIADAIEREVHHGRH